MDVSYFDTAFTDEPVKLTPVEHQFLENLNQTQFKGFSYTNKQYTSWHKFSDLNFDTDNSNQWSMWTQNTLDLVEFFYVINVENVLCTFK